MDKHTQKKKQNEKDSEGTRRKEIINFVRTWHSGWFLVSFYVFILPFFWNFGSTSALCINKCMCYVVFWCFYCSLTDFVRASLSM